jgi:purine nucleosidase
MTVTDWWGVSGRPKNAMFMRDVDADGFYALLTERLSWLGRADRALPKLRRV